MPDGPVLTSYPHDRVKVEVLINGKKVPGPGSKVPRDHT
jgi:hypothetical protein